MTDLKDFEHQLADHLAQCLPERRLKQAIAYSLLAPGKRIRPRLSLACAKMVGLSEAASQPAAVAIELVHCFTLIHDDLPCMDDDDFRRGRPSSHKQFDEATALLAGDGLLAMAALPLLSPLAGVTAQAQLRAVQRLHLAALKVIDGQLLETSITSSSTLATLTEVHELKTGALFEAALLMPLDLRGIGYEDPKHGAVQEFASVLGRGFQLADDLEDLQASTAKPNVANILTHVGTQEICNQWKRQIQAAKTALSEFWGEAAQDLALICDEVAIRIYT